MRVVATVTSKFGQRGYSGVPVPRVESYAVDSALDTDADQFSIDVADIKGELTEVFRRDSEVRIGLSIARNNINFQPLLQGFADSIVVTHDGTLSFQGRDLSAAAIDDTAIPYNWRNMRPAAVIVDHARQRGFTRFGGVLASHKNTLKPFRHFYTDGSESEWAMWYRMVRNRQMWIWCGPAGTLYVDKLNYGNNHDYLFGAPNKQYPNKEQWIRVMELEEHKNTQTRVGQVWVFGDTGQLSFAPIKVSDPKIKEWIKKPLNIVPATTGITNRNQAIKEAHEQIFEGMVGELEILIRIADPGFLVKQNTIAVLNIPKIGLSGEFFVVGNRVLGGTTGGIQEIRLREKVYALTRRVPSDPILSDESKNLSANSLGANLSIAKANWGEYFVVAAQAWHGGWDFSLFLATLLAICNHESSFRNVREGGGDEWYPKPQPGSLPGDTPAVTGPLSGDISPKKLYDQAVEIWRKDFANSQNNPLNPYGPGREAGVGPMQLTDLTFKEKADSRFGKSGEYDGGRWDAASNIWEGAEVLAGKLQGLPQTTANFWVGVARYNGSGPAAIAYAKAIEHDVNTTYLSQVQAGLKTAETLPANSTKTLKQLPNTAPPAIRKIINYAERQLGKDYQLGASGPDTYDCSGLVWAAYNAAGLSAQIGGRQTTWGYWGAHDIKPKPVANLVYIPVDSLGIGDMVFFNVFGESGGPPQHMGIFYGDNSMIVAPHTGETVRIQSISAPSSWACLGGKAVRNIWPNA